jgi:enamine deaminase RidA (YjgF/YER057c/UK114 family)
MRLALAFAATFASAGLAMAQPAAAPSRPAATASSATPSAPAAPASASGGEQVRTYASPTSAFASTITNPPGYVTIYVAGRVAPPVTAATQTTPAVYGNTEQQTEATLAQIERDLRDQGASLGDIVSMTVYLVGVPEQQGRMDFAGMNRAYARRFGTPEQPNRPVRTTVQVAGLAGPGLLVEITVIAARPLATGR